LETAGGFFAVRRDNALMGKRSLEEFRQISSIAARDESERDEGEKVA